MSADVAASISIVARFLAGFLIRAGRLKTWRPQSCQADLVIIDIRAQLSTCKPGQWTPDQDLTVLISLPSKGLA
jgi:hypothetical protein